VPDSDRDFIWPPDELLLGPRQAADSDSAGSTGSVGPTGSVDPAVSPADDGLAAGGAPQTFPLAPRQTPEHVQPSPPTPAQPPAATPPPEPTPPAGSGPAKVSGKASVPPVPPDQPPEERLAAVWGRELAGTLIPVSYSAGAFRVAGFVQRVDSKRHQSPRYASRIESMSSNAAAGPSALIWPSSRM